MASNEQWEEVPTENWQEVPVGQKPDMMENFATNYGLPAVEAVRSGLKSVMTPVLSGVGAISDFADKYTMAPIRAGAYRAMQGKPEEALSAAYQQFGEDPTKAPSGKDIMAEAGLSTKEYPTQFTLNPYTGSEGKFKVSPAGVAGAALETFADPVTFSGMAAGKVARAGLKGAEYALKGAGLAGEIATPKIAKLVARVPEESTRAFMQNPERITQNARKYTPEDIKDILDETVGEAKSKVIESTAEAEKLRSGLKQKLLQKRQDLQRQTIPSNVVNEIQGSLENQKSVLGELSVKADEALANSGKEFTKKGLLSLIDSIGASAGPYVIGDARTNAVNKLKATRERIEQSMPDFIPAKDMRDVLQQIRADIDFDLNAGEFNTDLNRMRKEFSARISENLKKFVPEYASYMDQMSQLSDSLGQMNKMFGSEKYPAKAYGTLQNLRKGGRQDIIDMIKRNAELTKNQMLMGTLGQYQRDASLMNRFQRGEDLSKELFPEDLARLQDMEAKQKMAEDIYNPVARLRPGTDKTQSVVRRFGQPTASIEDARAIEEAGKMANLNLSQILKDSAVYRDFGKDATAGSRNVKQFGLPGYIADRFGGPMIRGGIRGGVALKGGMEKVLNYLQTDPNFAEKYGRFFKASAVGGMGLSSATHHLLLNNDPEYRKYFEEGTQ